VQEVAELGFVTPLPGVHGAVLGVTNLRGVLVTIVGLEALMTGGAATVTDTVVIVVEDGRRVGLAVDEVLAFGAVESATVLEPGGLLAPIFDG
jgi:chemotaxis signal transduction protein